MLLHAAILAAVFALAPDTTPARAEEIFDNVTAATDEVNEVLELVVTLRYESQFRKDVENCTVKGDHGLALGGPQLHRHWRGGFSDRDFCSSPSLQAQLGLRALRACRGGGSVRRAFARFLGRAENDAEVSRRVAAYERARRLAALEVPNG